MSTFVVKIKRGRIEISKEVFLALLDLSPIKEYQAYESAVATNEITLADLKELATRADIPYPLFFASKAVVDLHLKDKTKNLFEKLPGKPEMQVGLRGDADSSDIEMIVKDIARKQEFLKKRVLIGLDDNQYIGSLLKMNKTGTSNKDIAEAFRQYFGISLKELRKLSKDDVLSYVSRKAEEKNILISLSSYNYMPQNLKQDLGLSGLCIKDKKVPYIFVNTRDGDDKPKILEAPARQIFTVVSMLVCIGMNKFLLSTKTGKAKDVDYKKIYAIASEILVPRTDLDGVTISDIRDLTSWARVFKVTPSMFLICLMHANKISAKSAKLYLEELADARKEVNSKRKQALPVNGYKKYNGERFSKETVGAYRSGKITYDEAKNVLFRKGKMDKNLFQEYIAKF